MRMQGALQQREGRGPLRAFLLGLQQQLLGREEYELLSTLAAMRPRLGGDKMQEGQEGGGNGKHLATETFGHQDQLLVCNVQDLGFRV